MQATLAEPEILMRTGQPVSGTMPGQDCGALLERGEVTGDVTWLNRSTPNLKPETGNMELRAAVGVIEEEALKRGMEAKSKEFVENGAEVCAAKG